MAVTDRYLGVFEAFIQAGWQPVKLFTTLTDGRVHQHKATLEAAQRHALDLSFARMREDDLRGLRRLGCEVLVVASYAWRIGDWTPHLPYAINFHPAPLPAYRGPYPLVQGLLDGVGEWGVACHKISPAFDAGDVLASETFSVGPRECHESLDLKTQMAAQQLARRVAADFHALWSGARPQSGGAYVRHWTAAERTLDFSQSVAAILRRIDAFGLIETLAVINGVTAFIRRAVGWTAAHSHTPGAMIYSNNLAMVVAARDGFIGITEWSLLDPGACVGRIGR